MSDTQKTSLYTLLRKQSSLVPLAEQIYEIHGKTCPIVAETHLVEFIKLIPFTGCRKYLEGLMLMGTPGLIDCNGLCRALMGPNPSEFLSGNLKYIREGYSMFFRGVGYSKSARAFVRSTFIDILKNNDILSPLTKNKYFDAWLEDPNTNPLKLDEVTEYGKITLSTCPENIHDEVLIGTSLDIICQTIRAIDTNSDVLHNSTHLVALLQHLPMAYSCIISALEEVVGLRLDKCNELAGRMIGPNRKLFFSKNIDAILDGYIRLFQEANSNEKDFVGACFLTTARENPELDNPEFLKWAEDPLAAKYKCSKEIDVTTSITEIERPVLERPTEGKAPIPTLYEFIEELLKTKHFDIINKSISMEPFRIAFLSWLADKVLTCRVGNESLTIDAMEGARIAYAILMIYFDLNDILDYSILNSTAPTLVTDWLDEKPEVELVSKGILAIRRWLETQDKLLLECGIAMLMSYSKQHGNDLAILSHIIDICKSF